MGLKREVAPGKEYNHEYLKLFMDNLCTISRRFGIWLEQFYLKSWNWRMNY